jgi:hypothetical protein
MLNICIPTYNRERQLEQLTRQTLLPIHDRYGSNVNIIVRDNSIGIKGYDAARISRLLSFADYRLNSENLEYHGNILELYDASSEGSYIWIFPDDDIYVNSSIFTIINSIISRTLCADVILPPFSYIRRPSFLSTESLLSELSSELASESSTIAHATTFCQMLSQNLYPYIPLTSSFIFKKKISSSTFDILRDNSSNAWFHEVLMLSSVNQSSTIDILRGPPYVYYNEPYDSNNMPHRSGMSIQYFHENNIKLKKLRSVVLNQSSLYNLRESWRESMLWLIQDKDKTIAWTNSKLYSVSLSLKAIFYALCTLDIWLLAISICFLFLPWRILRLIRRLRGSHRAYLSSKN